MPLPVLKLRPRLAASPEFFRLFDPRPPAGLYHHPVSPPPVLEGLPGLPPALSMDWANALMGLLQSPFPLSCTPVLRDGRALNMTDPLPFTGSDQAQ